MPLKIQRRYRRCLGCNASTRKTSWKNERRVCPACGFAVGWSETSHGLKTRELEELKEISRGRGRGIERL